MTYVDYQAINFKFFSAVVGLISSLWVPLAVSVKILLILMAIDMVTGIACAARDGRLASAVGWKGVNKKAAVLIVILTSYLMQHVAESQVGSGFMLPVQLGAVVALAYVVIEAVSIVENCHNLGAPIPRVLVDALHKAGEITGTDPDPITKLP